MKEILFFSNNKNKINEISKLFAKTQYNLKDLNSFNKVNSPIENGKSFEENAKIKSLFGFKKFNTICFADDSGICIEAMGGRPGIKSKNFLESGNSRKALLNKIISITVKKNNTKAFFQTSICLSVNTEKCFFLLEKYMGK